MFLFVLLISGVTVGVSLNDPVIHGVNDVKAERKKISPDIAENGLDSFNLVAEIATLREIVDRQGQEMNAIRQETKVLKETTYQQGLLINALDREKKELRDKILNQERQIVDLVGEITVIHTREAKVVLQAKDMQTIIDQQDKNIRTMNEEINVLKETTTTQNSEMKQMEEYMQSQFLLTQPSDGVFNKQELSSQKIKENFNSTSKHLMNTGPVQLTYHRIAKAKRQTRVAASSGIAFTAYLSHNLFNLATGYTVKCDQVLTNFGNGFNAHTGSFIVPRTGVYLFTFFINSLRNSYTGVQLVVNDRNIVDAVAHPGGERHDVMGGNTAVVELTAGEAVWLEVSHSSTGNLYSDITYRYVTFSGVFLF